MSRETDPLSPEDRRNGWDEARLKKYLNERDGAVNVQHRLGPLGAQEKPPIRLQTSHDYDLFSF